MIILLKLKHFTCWNTPFLSREDATSKNLQRKGEVLLFFMIKITHNVSVMQIALYDHNTNLNKETRVSDIITSI